MGELGEMVNFHGSVPSAATDVLDTTSIELLPDNMNVNADELSFTLPASPLLYTHPSIKMLLKMKINLDAKVDNITVRVQVRVGSGIGPGWVRDWFGLGPGLGPGPGLDYPSQPSSNINAAAIGMHR